MNKIFSILCSLCVVESLVEDEIFKNNADKTMEQKLIMVAERFARTKNIPVEKILILDLQHFLSLPGKSFHTDMNQLLEKQTFQEELSRRNSMNRVDFVTALRFPYFVIALSNGMGLQVSLSEVFRHIRSKIIVQIVYSHRVAQDVFSREVSNIHITANKYVVQFCVGIYDNIVSISQVSQREVFHTRVCGPTDSCRQVNIEGHRVVNRLDELDHILKLTFRCNQTDVTINWHLLASDTAAFSSHYEKHVMQNAATQWDDPLLVTVALRRRNPQMHDLLKAFHVHVWLCLFLSNVIIVLLVSFAERRKLLPLIYEKSINLISPTRPIRHPRRNSGYILTAMGLLLNYLMMTAFSNDFTSSFLTTHQKPACERIYGDKYAGSRTVYTSLTFLLQGEAIYGLLDSDTAMLGAKVFQTYRYVKEFHKDRRMVKNAMVMFPRVSITDQTNPHQMAALTMSLAQKSLTLRRNREHGLLTMNTFRVHHRAVFKRNAARQKYLDMNKRILRRTENFYLKHKLLYDESGTTFSLSNLKQIFLLLAKVIPLLILLLILELLSRALN